MTNLDQNLPLGINRYTMLGAANNVGDSLVVQTLYRYWLSCQWDNYSREKTTQPGSVSISYAVLFPVVMCSPVLPFPSCPFSPLPKQKTSKVSISAQQNFGKNLPFPPSVKIMEKVTPAPAFTTRWRSPSTYGPSIDLNAVI